MDQEKKLLNKVTTLPDVLIDIIKTYLQNKSKVFLNKENYLQYHDIIRNLVPKTQMENYIRDMLRRDNDFVFNQILRENFKRWVQIKHYVHKQVIYCNYIFFVKDYCIQHYSPKCRQIVNDLLVEEGLSKNQYKNNIHKNKRWKI